MACNDREHATDSDGKLLIHQCYEKDIEQTNAHFFVLTFIASLHCQHLSHMLELLCQPAQLVNLNLCFLLEHFPKLFDLPCWDLSLIAASMDGWLSQQEVQLLQHALAFFFVFMPRPQGEDVKEQRHTFDFLIITKHETLHVDTMKPELLLGQHHLL